MTNLKPRREFLYITGVFLFFLLFAISILAGTKGLRFTDGLAALTGLFSGKEIPAGVKIILFKIRLPRALAAAFCGAALSVSGLILQTSLNNTLASPGIMGINSGAGLFALLASLVFPYSVAFRTAFAFTGSILAVLIVYLISTKAGVSRTTLILAGVAVSSLMSAGVDIIITLHPEIIADKVAFSLGGFQNLNLRQLYFALPVIVVAVAVLLLLSGGIDLFALGDEAAFGLGLNIKLYRLLAILISAVLAGCAVSLCGLLGFVGLIIPNFIRMMGKNKTRVNISLCVIFGSDFLMFCDLISRLLFYPYELPVGLFLSCLGCPFFIWMLISKKKHLSV